MVFQSENAVAAEYIESLVYQSKIHVRGMTRLIFVVSLDLWTYYEDEYKSERC